MHNCVEVAAEEVYLPVNACVVQGNTDKYPVILTTLTWRTTKSSVPKATVVDISTGTTFGIYAPASWNIGEGLVKCTLVCYKDHL